MNPEGGRVAKGVNDIVASLAAQSVRLTEACESKVQDLLTDIAQMAEQTGEMVTKGVMDAIYKITDTVLGASDEIPDCVRSSQAVLLGMAQAAEQSGGSITKAAIASAGQRFKIQRLACARQVAHLDTVFNGVSDSFKEEDLMKMKNADVQLQKDKNKVLKYLHAFEDIARDLHVIRGRNGTGEEENVKYQKEKEKQFKRIYQTIAPSSRTMVQYQSLPKMETAVHFLQYLKHKCYCKLKLVTQVASLC